MSVSSEPQKVVRWDPALLDAVLRPFGRPSRRFRIVLVLLAIVVGAGLLSWVFQLRQGMAVAGYSDRSFWAVYIADVVSFIGVSYGGAVVSAILLLAGASWRAPLVRIAEGIALVTVVVGAAFIIPHLGRPDRLLGMITHANVASPVFWDMVAIATYTFATVVFFALPLVPDTATLLAERGDDLGRPRRGFYQLLSRGWVGSEHQRTVLHAAMVVVAIVIIPLAVSVHSVLAWAFSLVSRPGWHESIWAPYFVVAALYSGVALVIVVTAAFRRGYHLHTFITTQHFVRLGYILVVLAAVYAYLTFADLLPGAYVGEEGPTAIIHGMLLGRVAIWFWLFLVMGTIAPIVMIAMPWTRNVGGIVTASTFVLVGMWIKRLIMVSETSSYDRLTNTFTDLFRFTWVSALTSAAGVAAIALLLMLLFRVVPVLALNEMREPATPDGQHHKEPPDAPTTGSRAAAHLTGAAILLALAAGAISIASASSSYAQQSPSPAPTDHVVRLVPVVRLSATTSGPDNTATATVLLDGSPIKGAVVDFYESVGAFRPDDDRMHLGTAQTGADGIATVTYTDATTGARTLTAAYYPDVMGDPIVATTTLEVTHAVPAYRQDPPRPLAQVGQVLATCLFGLVAVVLAILVGQIVRVRRSCRPITGTAPDGAD